MLEPKKRINNAVATFYNVCDIETNPDGSLLAGGLAYYDNNLDSNTRAYFLFHNWGEFISFVVSRAKHNKNLRTIYAHHGANFDWLSLMRYLVSNDLLATCKIITAGSIGIGMNISLGNDKGTIYLRDSLRLMPQSLDKLCKTFKTEYQKISIDKLPHEILKENPELFYNYLKNDCYSLQDVLHAFHKLINEKIGPIEKLPMTLASLSMIIFRTFFLKQPIKTTWNKKQKIFFRRAYVGGRTDVLQPGEFEGVNAYDINSLYPAVMRECEVPLSYRVVKSKTFYFDKLGIYACSFTQHDRTMPPILRDESTCEYQYSGSGVFCSSELLSFIGSGGEIKIQDGYVFQSQGILFGDFINTLYRIRLDAQRNGDDALSYVVKILMNSHYGKYGEHESGEVLVKASKELALKLLYEKKKFSSYGEFFGVIEHKHKEHSFVAIAAFITANARVRLWHLIKTAGQNALYCDTDSIYMTGTLPDKMLSNELGMLKKEFTGNAVFIGRKLFALKDLNNKEKIRAKGVKIGGRNGALLSYNDMLIMMYGFEMRREYQTANTLKQVLTKGKDACRFETRHRTLRPTANSIWRNVDLRRRENEYTI